MQYNDNIIHPKPKIQFIKKENRCNLVPEQGYCSTAPAEYYQDALISANSGVKMMIFGNPRNETTIFNHEKLYIKKYSENITPPNIASLLPQVRKLLMQGKSKEACELSVKEARKQGYAERMPWNGDLEMPHSNSHLHSACAMKYDLPNTSPITNYLRTLDLSTGEAIVRWEDDNGSYLRKSFVHGKNRTCVQKMETLKGTNGICGNIELSLDVILGKHDWERMDTPSDMEVTSTYTDTMLVLGCKYSKKTMGNKGYAVVTKIIHEDGVVTLQENKIVLTGVKSFTLLTQVEPIEEYSEKEVSEIAKKLDTVNTDYDELIKYNVQTIGEMMSRSKLKLNPHNDALCSVEELLTLQHGEQDLCPALMEHLYDMGRYFLITECGEFAPAIGQYNINVNLQVCAGNLTNLPEAMDIFFKFVEGKFDDFRLNAKNIFGCRGIIAPVHLDIDNGMATHFSSTWPHHYWTTCAGWIYNEFWGHYLVTGDKDFLKERVIPALREIALFFEDYLVDTDENGKYIFYPCYSPEHCPDKKLSGVTINSCMDIMICREVMENLIFAYEALEIKCDDTQKWMDILSKLPTYLSDEEGALKEWAWESIPEEYDHRHVSHHYDVWPGNGITWEKTPNLARAVQLSNRKRGQENDSAHGIMHRLFTAIRLKDTQSAYIHFKQILEHGFVNRNMMTNHYPYNVYFPDITGSMPAALVEMLIYSNPGIIEFFPATPKVLSQGKIEGICTYSFAHIDTLEWNFEKGIITAQISSLEDQTIKLVYRHDDYIIKINDVLQQAKDNSCDVALLKGEKITVDIIVR